MAKKVLYFGWKFPTRAKYDEKKKLIEMLSMDPLYLWLNGI
jgi:hypothetical protein